MQEYWLKNNTSSLWHRDVCLFVYALERKQHCILFCESLNWVLGQMLKCSQWWGC